VAIIYAPVVQPTLGSLLSGLCSCSSGLTVGTVVYFSGASTVDAANAIDLTASPAIGLVYYKPTPTTCIVMYAGEFTGLSGITPDATYFLDDSAGLYSTTPPSAPGEVVQRLGVGKNTTTLVLDINREFQQL
jgi:hypothetical protein